MKKAIYFIGLAFALLLAAASCQKAPFLTFNGQKSFTFKDTGGSETITFSCNRAWTAKSSESWLTVSPAQGDANEEGVRVTITCAANTTYDPRNATVTIMSEGLSETISVSQETNYGLMSEPTTFNLTNEAQYIEITVQANILYTITIDDAGKDWISQVSTKALTSDKLFFSIAANEGYDDREGKITISEASLASSSVQPQVITVKQSQTNGLFITTPEYALSNESHDLTIEVKANVSYEVTPEVDWIKYEASSTKALSATTFTLKVDKNETYDQRVGTVKVKGGGLEGVITITQAENLGLFVSPTEVQISKEAQEVEVEVQANVEYDIIVPEEAKGMITTIKTEGGETKALVAKKVRFGILENSLYEEREATITFKQKNGALCGTIKICQAPSDYIHIEQNCVFIGNIGGIFSSILLHNCDYDIIIEDEWIKKNETKSMMNDEIQFIVDNNNTGKSRCSTIIVASKDKQTQSSISVYQSTNALLSSAPANCYIISKSGEYSIPIVFGNSYSIINKSAESRVVWESFCSDEDIEIGDLVSSVEIDDNFLNIKTNGGFKNGNALVSVNDSRGNILWSWHLWFCEDYDPTDSFITFANNAGILMDRNLGATSVTPGDIHSLGLLFEWGRKDPFLNANSVSFSFSTGQKIAKSTPEFPAPILATAETGTVEFSIKNPTTYIYGSSQDDFDWHYGSRVDTLWTSSTKTIYDPCPSGWHVPNGGSDNIWANAGLYESCNALLTGGNNTGLFFTSPATNYDSWYPYSGTRGCLNGLLGDVGFAACYHTNSVIGIYAQSMYFAGKNNFHPRDYVWRDNGGTIRCQKE